MPPDDDLSPFRPPRQSRFAPYATTGYPAAPAHEAPRFALSYVRADTAELAGPLEHEVGKYAFTCGYTADVYYRDATATTDAMPSSFRIALEDIRSGKASALVVPTLEHLGADGTRDGLIQAIGAAGGILLIVDPRPDTAPRLAPARSTT